MVRVLRLGILVGLLGLQSMGAKHCDLVADNNICQLLLYAGRPDIQQQQQDQLRQRMPKKKWTFFVYMASDNNLLEFGKANIAQMMCIGSNENVNLVVHMDLHMPGTKKVTKRLYIEKDHVIQIGPDSCMNSGSAETFYEAMAWAITNYPSDHLAVVMWDHGSGDLNPRLRGAVRPAPLFTYNPATNLFELDRSIEFSDFLNKCQLELEHRGICFDETFGDYLDDQKLLKALELTKKILGKNIDIVLFDACFMAGVGTAWIFSQFADYMVASEEAVLGPGYNYTTLTAPFAQGILGPQELACAAVRSVKELYGGVTEDYTHSALKLSEFSKLCDNIDLLAKTLITAIQQQVGDSVINTLKKSIRRPACTCFDEPNYKDLYHLYSNLYSNIAEITLKPGVNKTLLVQSIRKILQDGLVLIPQVVIANICGKNIAGAHGLYIYCPEGKGTCSHHASFAKTGFGLHNSWVQLIATYAPFPY